MMIDPECKYCPSCNEEYRAEIVLCADCGIELIGGEEMLEKERAVKARKKARKGDITPDDDIVSIHKGQLADLKVLEKELARENIGVLLSGDESSCGKGCCSSSFFLQVRREDARDAVEVVQQYIDRTTAISHHDLTCAEHVYNPQAGTAVCPACGFTFETSTSTCPDCGLCFG